MPILNIQKRARELGRIRLGQKGDRGQPEKLDRFRLTSASQALLEKIAELYGGEVRPWTPEGGSPQFEVVTNSTRLPIMVPPQPVTQWHEVWRKSGCVHRCDGHTNVLTDEPCDPEDPVHLEALNKPTTRLNVVLRDVEGIGVWRVETHGWNAAIELPDVAEFLAQAGGYVNGWLSLEQRTSVDNSGSRPQTRHYIVPIIEIDVTPTQLMSGKGRVQAPTVEGPVARPVLAAGGDAGNPYAGYTEQVAAATSRDGLASIWADALAAGLVGTQSSPSPARAAFFEVFQARSQAIAPAVQTDADGAVDAVVVDHGDPDAVWQRVMAVAGGQGLSLGDVEDEYGRFSNGLTSADATAAQLEEFLTYLSQANDQAVSA